MQTPALRRFFRESCIGHTDMASSSYIHWRHLSNSFHFEGKSMQSLSTMWKQPHVRPVCTAECVHVNHLFSFLMWHWPASTRAAQSLNT